MAFETISMFHGARKRSGGSATYTMSLCLVVTRSNTSGHQTYRSPISQHHSNIGLSTH